MIDLKKIADALAKDMARAFNEKSAMELKSSHRRWFSPSRMKEILPARKLNLRAHDDSKQMVDRISGILEEWAQFRSRGKPAKKLEAPHIVSRQQEKPTTPAPSRASWFQKPAKKLESPRQIERQRQKETPAPTVAQSNSRNEQPTTPARPFWMSFQKTPTTQAQKSPQWQEKSLIQKILFPFWDPNEGVANQRLPAPESRQSLYRKKMEARGAVLSQQKQERVSSPRAGLEATPAPRSLLSRVINWMGGQHAERDREDYGQQWWKRGFGNGTKGTPKRSRFTRSARLQTKAQKRLDNAIRTRDTLGGKIGTSSYNEAAHKQAIASVKAAQERLGQATGLNAKATTMGAGASTKVAEALGRLGGGLIGLGKLGWPVAMASFVARTPWIVRDLNDARINSLRHRGDHMGENAAAMTIFDKMTAQLAAKQVKDTAESTQWLVDEQNKLRRNLQPIGAKIENAVNGAMGIIPAAINGWVEGHKILVDETQAADELTKEGLIRGRNFMAWNKDEEKLVQKRANEIAQKRADQQNEPINKAFAANIYGWVDAINYKQDARRNNLPKKPLPRF